MVAEMLDRRLTIADRQVIDPGSQQALAIGFPVTLDCRRAGLVEPYVQQNRLDVGYSSSAD